MHFFENCEALHCWTALARYYTEHVRSVEQLCQTQLAALRSEQLVLVRTHLPYRFSRIWFENHVSFPIAQQLIQTWRKALERNRVLLPWEIYPLQLGVHNVAARETLSGRKAAQIKILR